jgi:tetratricopeptide (TPR) repeat protein
MLSIAHTLRWLGHAYQNIPSKRVVNRENDLLFSQLFTISESLLLILDNEDSRRELADLYYQAWPFMYGRQNPYDLEGICSLYNKALVCNPSKETQVRVANMRFQTFFKSGKKTESLPYIQEAIRLGKELPENDQNTFLLANVYYYYTGYLMDSDCMEFEEAESYLSIALKHAALCREKGEDHLYFGLYDMRMAELRYLMGENHSAKKSIEQAIKTLKNYPDSLQAFIGEAEALQAIINESLKNSLLEGGLKA